MFSRPRAMAPLGGFVLFALFTLLFLPTSVSAQSAIAGLVTDSSGAVLPGVTVEASSPALIEKVRAAITDDQGRYTVVDLRPGVYSVNFTLPGFTTVVRDRLDLPSGFTATVNVELRVGAVEETVTVSGQAPAVDVHQTQRTDVLAREVIDALPTGRGYRSVGVLLPAVTGGGVNRPMVGDVSVPPTLATQGGTSWESTQQIDGILVTTLHANTFQPYNDAMIQESTYQTTALGADVSRGGVRVNLIGRDGGNTFVGGAIFNVSNGSWQANNLTQELIARNLRAQNKLYHSFDLNPWFSGPIARDTVWIFGSYRYQEHQSLTAGSIIRDGVPRVTGGHITNVTGRTTWQAAAKHKISLHADYTGRDDPVGWSNEAASNYRPDSMYYLGIAKWSAPLTNRFLLEAGYSWNQMGYTKRYLFGEPTRGTPEWFAQARRQDIGTGVNWAAGQAGVGAFMPTMANLSGAMSYVTGSHNIKIGFQHGWGNIVDSARWNGDVYQIYVNGVPTFVDVLNSPTESRNSINAELGVYAQDAWTIGRLTVNAGARFEHFRASIDPTFSQAGRFLPDRSFAGTKNLHNFNDVVPRLGIAYDLFGNGRTAIKASVGKYVAAMALGNPEGLRNYDPTAPLASSAGAAPPADRRDWNDRDRQGRSLPTNGDDIAQDNEIGPSNNLSYGLRTFRRFDPDAPRGYNIEYTASVQHEFWQGIAASLFYQRRPYRNRLTSRNQLADVADYASFQVSSPLDGQPITIYNLDRSKQGQVDLLDTASDLNERVYQGYHLVVTGRLPRGGTVLGGWSAERRVDISCDTNNPNEFRFCDQRGQLFQELGRTAPSPYVSSFKVLSTVPGLPYNFTGSIALRSYVGDPMEMNWVVPASLFPGGRTQPVTVPLLAPNSQFLPRWTQLDLSAKRTFQLRGLRLVADLSVFNVLNASTVITQVATFGAAFGTPTSIIPGRLPRLGLQVSW